MSMAAALRSNDVVQGVLVVAGPDPRGFSSGELEFLVAMANQIGLAVDNARLHGEAGRKLQIQAQLNELAERMAAQADIESVMPGLLSSIKELTGADESGVSLTAPDGARGFSSFSLPGEGDAGGLRPERAPYHEVTLTGRPAVIDHYASYPGALPELVSAGLLSLAAVPIFYGDQVYGMLTLFNFQESKTFAESDIAVALEIGRLTGLAIENARLHQRTRFYVRQVTRAQEDERRRIARELHDETIQRLVVISRRLESLLVGAEGLSPAARASIVACDELLTETMRGVRRFVQDLRPPMLDHLGLVASVSALADE
jgi:GAF domain-containing protein